LSCVSILEHFEIHCEQGDWLAAAAIARRIGFDKEIQNNLNYLGGIYAKENKLGWHNLELKKENGSKGGVATRGMKWFNNGNQETRSLICPINWNPGRLNSIKSGFEKGRKLGVFWNNGKENKRSLVCPGEEWIRGKYLTEEQRQKRIEIATGRVHTDEHKKKISDGVKLKYQLDPELWKKKNDNHS